MSQIAQTTPPRQRYILVKDEAHLKFIRTLPCCCCRLEGHTEPHHLLRVPTNERGGARKSGDDWVIPLAAHIHYDLHNRGVDERDFLASYDVYGPGLAALLYRLSGNEDACRRVIWEIRDRE